MAATIVGGSVERMAESVAAVAEHLDDIQQHTPEFLGFTLSSDRKGRSAASNPPDKTAPSGLSERLLQSSSCTPGLRDDGGAHPACMPDGQTWAFAVFPAVLTVIAPPDYEIARPGDSDQQDVTLELRAGPGAG
jgi:hypothetical protein